MRYEENQDYAYLVQRVLNFMKAENLLGIWVSLVSRFFFFFKAGGEKEREAWG